MHLPVIENAFFLKSVGWAIINSIWQTGMLWAVYLIVIRLDKRLPAIAKHHLAIALLTISMLWFVYTIIGNYQLLKNAESPDEITLLEQIIKPYASDITNMFPVISLIYFCAMGMYSIRFFKNLRGNGLLQSTGLAKAPFDLRLFTKHTSRHLGINKKIQVWISDLVDVPSVTGYLKPIILLPAAVLNNLTVKQVEAILIHELAHIKRNDYLLNMYQAVIELVLFFNPFVYALGKVCRQERENCCDDCVLNYKYDRYEYATALLILEEHRNKQLCFALAATNNKKHLLKRIQRLFTNTAGKQFSLQQQLSFAGLCLLLLSFMFIALPVIHQKSISEFTIIQKPSILPHQQVNILPAIEPSIESPKGRNIVNHPGEIASVAKKKPSSIRKTAKKKSPRPKEVEYTDAFVNEDLLKDPVTALEAQPAALIDIKENNKDTAFYVRIEEQQSGDKQTKTYYFELQSNNGTPEVKPLVILHKVKLPAKKLKKAKSNNGLAGGRSKRVTS